MIGMKNRELHGMDGIFHGSLRLCKTKFSQELVLTGYSPKLEGTPRSISPTREDKSQDGREPRRSDVRHAPCL